MGLIRAIWGYLGLVRVIRVSLGLFGLTVSNSRSGLLGLRRVSAARDIRVRGWGSQLRSTVKA